MIFFEHMIQASLTVLKDRVDKVELEKKIILDQICTLVRNINDIKDSIKLIEDEITLLLKRYNKESV